MKSPVEMEAPPNILLIRLKSIGDILFTLPATRLLRENFPGAKITFLVSREHTPLIQGFGDVDEVLALDRAMYRRGNPLVIVRETLALLRRLRQARFSLAVDFQGYGETALLTWLTRAGERWGSVYQRSRRWAYTRGVWRRPDLHPAEWNLRLLETCGLRPGEAANEFLLPAAALDDARGLFTELGLDAARRALFIQPFTSSPQKNWPLDRYLALARHWRSQGVQVLFGGGPGDRDALEPARQAGFPVSAGAPLLLTAGLMKLCGLVVGGDTGLLHLAVAMGRRVLMLMASTAPGCPYPFRHQNWTVTPPPGQAVSGIETDAVIAACARAFAELDARGASAG